MTSQHESRWALGPRVREDEIAQLLGGVSGSVAAGVARDEGVRLAVEFVQFEAAAAGAIGGGEAVGHVGGHVVVGQTLHDDGRRQRRRRLAAFQDQLRVALRHLGFRGPIGVMRLDQPRVALLLHHAVARQRVGDRPAQHQVRQARILAGQRQGRIARVVGQQRAEQQLMRAARGAEPADQIPPAAELVRMRLQPARREIDVGDRGGIAVFAAACGNRSPRRRCRFSPAPRRAARY